jgi:uncharacterized protein YegJ (DUF2314 family)
MAVAALAATLAVTLAGCNKAAEDDNLILSKPDDAPVLAAERKAAETLPIFWAKFDAQEPGVSRYLVKVALQAKGGGAEVLWATPLRRTATGVEVRLANEPVYVAELKLGSVIEVLPSEIMDWSYQKDGKAYGHFVSRAMLDRAPPEARAEMEAVLSPTPLESKVR